MPRANDPRRNAEHDIVEESSEDSFPASDAPSFTPVSGVRAGRMRNMPEGTPTPAKARPLERGPAARIATSRRRRG